MIEKLTNAKEETSDLNRQEHMDFLQDSFEDNEDGIDPNSTLLEPKKAKKKQFGSFNTMGLSPSVYKGILHKG